MRSKLFILYIIIWFKKVQLPLTRINIPILEVGNTTIVDLTYGPQVYALSTSFLKERKKYFD